MYSYTHSGTMGDVHHRVLSNTKQKFSEIIKSRIFSESIKSRAPVDHYLL